MGETRFSLGWGRFGLPAGGGYFRFSPLCYMFGYCLTGGIHLSLTVLKIVPFVLYSNGLHDPFLKLAGRFGKNARLWCGGTYPRILHQHLMAAKDRNVFGRNLRFSGK